MFRTALLFPPFSFSFRLRFRTLFFKFGTLLLPPCLALPLCVKTFKRSSNLLDHASQAPAREVCFRSPSNYASHTNPSQKLRL